eukprot:2321386-Rhodomonas_salina.1
MPLTVKASQPTAAIPLLDTAGKAYAQTQRETNMQGSARMEGGLTESLGAREEEGEDLGAEASCDHEEALSLAVAAAPTPTLSHRPALQRERASEQARGSER